MRHSPLVAALGVGSVLLALPACGGLARSVKPEHQELVRQFPRRLDKAVARELRFGAALRPQDRATWYVEADAETSEAVTGGPPGSIPYLAATDNVWRAALSDERLYGLRYGDTATTGFAGGAHAHLGEYGLRAPREQVERTARAAAQWIDKESGAIGRWAPEGTLLYLDVVHAHSQRAGQPEAIDQLALVLLLMRGDEPVVAVGREFTIYTHRAESTRLELPDGLVAHGTEGMKPSGQKALASLGIAGLDQDLCLMIDDALAELRESAGGAP